MGGIARANARELKRFNHRWEALYEKFPAARAAAVFEMGKAVKAEVDVRIVERGVDDLFGHIRNAQTLRLGSYGGYAAVSAAAYNMVDRYGRGKSWKGKMVSTRQVTRWLERGHGARTPSGTAKRYRPNIKKAGIGAKGNAYIKARQFYSFAKSDAFDLGLKAASKVLNEIAEEVDY